MSEIISLMSEIISLITNPIFIGSFLGTLIGLLIMNAIFGNKG